MILKTIYFPPSIRWCWWWRAKPGYFNPVIDSRCPVPGQQLNDHHYQQALSTRSLLFPHHQCRDHHHGVEPRSTIYQDNFEDQETSFYCTKFWPAIYFIVIIFYPSQLESQCCSEDDVHTTWVAAAEPSQCQWHINTNSSLAITPRRQSYLPCFVILFPFINKRIRYLCTSFFLFSSCSWLLSAFNMVAEHSARQG